MRLSVEGLTVRFGAVAALNRVSLQVSSGERLAVIGPNGAGKTTLFNVIAGDLPAAAGSVSFDGREVTRLASWRRARLGLGRTFQRSTLFGQLTVAENLALAVRTRLRGGWRFWPSRRERVVEAEVAQRLRAGGLETVAQRPALALAHGEQRSLEVELALAAGPRALLLDEPMAGLAGPERQAAVERLRALPREVTLVIVEHDLDAVFALAERIAVLDHGVVIADGPPEQVRSDARVQEVYLGA
ncbi:MAG TPA: ABC transporter ATP-binding protein [Candidatus Acidoferrales bacterium]|nr:ABC transporter ATP-binding protein [Candidatus Acidoferrales bacterium]